MEDDLRKTVLENTDNKNAIEYWQVKANVLRQLSLSGLNNQQVRSLWRSGIIDMRDMAEYARAKQIIRNKNKVVNLSLFSCTN